MWYLDEERKFKYSRYTLEQIRKYAYYDALDNFLNFWRLHEDAIKKLKLNNYKGLLALLETINSNLQFKWDFFYNEGGTNLPLIKVPLPESFKRAVARQKQNPKTFKGISVDLGGEVNKDESVN